MSFLSRPSPLLPLSLLLSPPSLKPHKMVMVLALALVLAGAFALPVQATTLDFTLGLVPGGTVSYAGGLSPIDRSRHRCFLCGGPRHR